MNDDIQDGCYRVSEDVNAPMVCNDGTTSTGTEGIQGLVGVTSILTSIMMIVFFYVKVVRKKKNNFTIVNPYEAPTVENFKGYLDENKPVLSPLLAQQKEGWYPTPEGHQERFWNGQEWTDEYRERIVIVPEEKISESRLSPEDIAEILAAEEAEAAEAARAAEEVQEEVEENENTEK